MTGKLSGEINGIPERFVPAEMHGMLVEAEHMARYWWASNFVEGRRRVLDAGCGVGYGALLLKQAGAEEVTAVDLAESVIDVASQSAVDGLVWEVANIGSLPHGDDSFDLITCFEVIEHVDDPGQVLDELARVLHPDGLLLISSPNRGHYMPGNPHHVHEYVPSELCVALERRFAQVRLLPQHAMLASVIGSDDRATFEGKYVERLVQPKPEDEIYTLAMAGRELPPNSSVVALTQILELRQWLEHIEGQQNVLEEQAIALRNLESMRKERLDLLDLLAHRETGLAEMPALRARVGEAEAELEPLRSEIKDLKARLGAMTQAADVVEGMSKSLSWRMTAPLRGVKRMLSMHR